MIQILHYIPMFTLFFPENVLKMFSFTGLVNLENEYLSTVFLLHVDENKISNNEAVDYRFENQGYESKSILQNSADAFISLLLLVFYYALIVLLYCLVKRKDEEEITGKWHQNIFKVLQKEYKNIMLSGLFRVGLEIYLDMVFGSVLNLYYAKFNSGVDIYSASLSFLILVGSIAFTIIVTVISFKIEKYGDDAIHKYTYSSIFEAMKEDRKSAYFIHLIFMARRLVLISLIVLGTNNGLIQTITFAIIVFLNSAYLVIYRPMKSTKLNFQEICYEGILTIVTCIFVYYKDPDTEFLKTGTGAILGYVCIALVASTVVIHYVLMGIEAISYFKNKNKVANLEVETPHKPDFNYLRGINTMTPNSSVLTTQNNSMIQNRRPKIEENKYQEKNADHDQIEIRRLTKR